MNKAFFFQTKQIPVRNKSSHGASLRDDSSLFDEFKKQKIYFSYFQVDHKYYLFFYSQKSIDINFIYQSVNVLQELDSKQRKIRSMRGFFLYALEILETGKDYEILQTNLPPFFWRKVKNIIRQNKKAALQEFLFGSQDSIVAPETQNHLNEKIETLQNQVNSLQDRIRDLETTLENSKYALSRTLKASEATKIIQQDDSTLKDKKGSYLTQNDSTINHQVREVGEMNLEMLSEDDNRPSDKNSERKQYDTSSNQKQAQNEQNFITLSQILEEEKIEIIQTGFRFNQQGKLSLKEYYESTQEHSLFQFKGYSIKYESIRRTKLYKQLKA